MRDAARLRDPSTYRGGNADPQVLSERRRSEWARRTPEEKERHLGGFIAAGQVHNRRSSKTRIEQAVARMLEEAGLVFQQNAQIGRFNVDFLCGRTIIECFGDFWHCNPLSWPPDAFNRSLRMAAQEKWEKDAHRIARLEAQGFRCCVLWESEITGDPADVRRRIHRLMEDIDDAVP